MTGIDCTSREREVWIVQTQECNVEEVEKSKRSAREINSLELYAVRSVKYAKYESKIVDSIPGT